MSRYDEDLYENPFFMVLEKNFSTLFEEATACRWIVSCKHPIMYIFFAHPVFYLVLEQFFPGLTKKRNIPSQLRINETAVFGSLEIIVD